MRKSVLKYKEKTGRVPDLGIIFCGDRAVVTLRKEGFSPIGHEVVFYGLLFWLRLGIACSKVYFKNVIN